MNLNDMIVIIFLIGVFRLLSLGEISSVLTKPIINQALELEDILSLLGIEEHQQKLTKL